MSYFLYLFFVLKICFSFGHQHGMIFVFEGAQTTFLLIHNIYHFFVHHSTHVPRGYDEALSKWCATQRMRCRELMNGDTKTPLNQAQFHALQSLGFEMSVKRKQYDRSMIDKKWEERL